MPNDAPDHPLVPRPNGAAAPADAAAASDPVQAQPDALAAALVASAADAILAFDNGGRITVWNAACEALFGWSAAEMIGARLDALVPEQRRSELARVVHALAGGSEEAALETERLHRSGVVLPVSCRLSPIRTGTGEVLGVCAVVRDISREVEVRQQLRVALQAAQAR
ncbi:MAG TPA: PAS domain-containing protein, partial [Mycobacteriales bacterium]|nr:PAS domain-containing protein [Mycobacteriales bacterium]